MDKNTVLVLDANQRSALAATRSLGKKSVRVVTADTTAQSLAGSSRYSTNHAIYRDPTLKELDFIEDIIDITRKFNVTVILPMTEVTTTLILRNNHKFREVSIPFISYDGFSNASNKYLLHQIAQSLGIPIPQTVFVDNLIDIEKTLGSQTYPIVLKPFRSRIEKDGDWIFTSVKYATTPTEAKMIIEGNKHFRDYPFLLQQTIQGEGQGVFAIYDQGKPIGFFAHKRIREKPITGGVSVLCESQAVDDSMRAYAEKLLNYFKWHGVAMVEFKIDEVGTPYLMEINARFWGSLQLAIDAGVDFPYLLYKIATGESPKTIDSYKVGLRSRWLLGDLDHIYLVWKSQEKHWTVPKKLRETLRFLNFIDPKVRFEINRIDDLGPFFYELRNYFRPSNT